MIYLKNMFKNLDRRLKVYQLIKKLKMLFLINFNNFQSEFIYLIIIIKASYN